MRHAFLRRAAKIWACQAATLLFLFTIITFIGVEVNEIAIKGLLTFYFAQPLDALIGGLLLVYEPPLLDILPIYVLFMLASPWVMSVGLRRGWAPVLAVSTLLWLLAQFGLSQWVYDAANAVVKNPIPFQETGTFSMWGWQFLWVLGLWMGASRNDPAAPAFTFPRWAVWAAVVLALAGFAWRHAIGQVPFGDGLPAWNLAFDKWQLGPLRVLNLFALLVLAIRFGPALMARLPRMRWLETLGRASLPVFCAHLVVVLLVLGWFGADYQRPWPVDIALLAACFGALYAVARVTLWLDRQPDDDTVPSPPPVPYAEKPPPLTHDEDELPRAHESLAPTARTL